MLRSGRSMFISARGAALSCRHRSCKIPSATVIARMPFWMQLTWKISPKVGPERPSLSSALGQLSVSCLWRRLTDGEAVLKRAGDFAGCEGPADDVRDAGGDQPIGSACRDPHGGKQDRHRRGDRVQFGGQVERQRRLGKMSYHRPVEPSRPISAGSQRLVHSDKSDRLVAQCSQYLFVSEQVLTFVIDDQQRLAIAKPEPLGCVPVRRGDGGDARQPNLEASASARRAVDIDGAGVLAHDLANGCKPEAVAAVAGCEKRFEQPLERL